MSVVGKLFGIWAVGKTVSSTTPLFMRLLLGMAALTACALIITLLTSALIVGGLWLIYSLLLTYGIEPEIAGLVVAGLVLALLAAAAMSAKIYWAKAQKMVARLQYVQSPMSGRMSDLANAFMEGYSTGQPSRRK